MYHNRTRHKDDEEALGALYVSFETLLKESDFVICTAPLTAETRDKFDDKAFKMMKKMRFLSISVEVLLSMKKH